MNLKRKYYFLLVLFINLITGCNTFNSSYLDSSFESDESLERTNSNYTKDYMYTSENSGYENGTSESSNIIDSYFSETHEIIRPASLDITNDAADAQESVGIYTDSNKFYCMNWNLAIDDYLVNQYTPKLQMDSGLYKVEDAAVIGIPENYYIDGDTSNFAVSVSNAESLINSWKIAFTGEEVGDLSVKNAEMYFEIIDNSYSLYSERIGFDGCIRLYGKLYCELSLCSNNPNLSYGDLVFYPYQHDIIEKGFCIIPFSTSIRNNDGNLFAMDTVPLYLGNVCDYQDIQIGLFSESNYLDKSLTLKNINLFFAQAQSGESRSTALIVENSV